RRELPRSKEMMIDDAVTFSRVAPTDPTNVDGKLVFAKGGSILLAFLKTPYVCGRRKDRSEVDITIPEHHETPLSSGAVRAVAKAYQEMGLPVLGSISQQQPHRARLAVPGSSLQVGWNFCRADGHLPVHKPISFQRRAPEA